MSWRDVPVAERFRLLESQNTEDLLHAAVKYKMPLETIKRRLRELKTEKDIRNSMEYVGRITASDPQAQKFTDWLVIEDENVMVCSDWEWPDTDVSLLADLLLVAMNQGIKTLVIAGDLIKGDGPLSTWPEIIMEDGQRSFDEELNLLYSVLSALALWFDRVYITTGNHDERINKSTGGAINLGMFLRYVNPKLTYSIHRKMYLKTNRATYKITHPVNYARNSLTLGQSLSNTDPGPDGNGERVGVIVAHTHLVSYGTTHDGSKEVVGLGCMRDPAKTKYLSISDATNPKWVPGFLMIRNGYFYPLWKNFTDWPFFQGEYYQTREAYFKSA